MREFIFPCIDVVGVMVPEHRYAELEEVVRCRDCRHFDNDSDLYGCDLLNFAMPHMEDGYCAWGVKK